MFISIKINPKILMSFITGVTNSSLFYFFSKKLVLNKKEEDEACEDTEPCDSVFTGMELLLCIFSIIISSIIIGNIFSDIKYNIGLSLFSFIILLIRGIADSTKDDKVIIFTNSLIPVGITSLYLLLNSVI